MFISFFLLCVNILGTTCTDELFRFTSLVLILYMLLLKYLISYFINYLVISYINWILQLKYVTKHV
jgi:hypothetical protein